MRWRIELTQYKFDIIYRQDKFNVASDALSHTYCAATTDNELYRVHAALRHPGITRLFHYIKVKSLPFSVEDVKRDSCFLIISKSYKQFARITIAEFDSVRKQLV
ncbi:Hypothetical predicted protein [Octopus vulgaris]|uniref:Uncharacterized protein n=1 Tax=Octopus vulgaris TaxID=6645 RepID=A0AA36F417_OCTVU|nr:Hypothetical predicted protein [Octopus vulgaris]